MKRSLKSVRRKFGNARARDFALLKQATFHLKSQQLATPFHRQLPDTMATAKHCTRSSTWLSKTFLQPPTSRSQVSRFSTSPQCRSKIGPAPFTLPPEVTFRLIQPPQQKAGRLSRAQAGSTIELEGPLGRMSLAMPAYMSVDHQGNQDGRIKSLQILDKEDRRQREMWG